MPSANIPEKTTPITVSALRRPVFAKNPDNTAQVNPEAKAPKIKGIPPKYANTMPGRAP